MPRKKRSKPGPKPRPPEETLSATYLLRARPDQLDAYRAAADALGVSLGEWVRTRLDGAVAR